MGFSEWFKLAERFVVAVEKLAESGRLIEVQVETPAISGPVDVKVEKLPELPSTAVAAPGEVATTAGEVIDREAIKKALHDRGIKFKASARTESLQKLLDAALAREKGPGVDDPFKDSPPPPPEKDPFATTGAKTTSGKVYTKDEVRDVLVAFSTLKGRDAALSILRTHGKAETLSGVDATYYADVVEACEKAKVS